MNTNFDQTLDRFRQTAERVQRERRAFMATQPPIVRCRVHSDCERRIDEELTARASANGIGGLKAGYTPCPKCLEDLQLERLQGYGVPDNWYTPRLEISRRMMNRKPVMSRW